MTAQFPFTTPDYTYALIMGSAPVLDGWQSFPLPRNKHLTSQPTQLRSESHNFNAPSLPFQGDQAVNAHATRAPPPPPPQGGGSGLSYHMFIEGR